MVLSKKLNTSLLLTPQLEKPVPEASANLSKPRSIKSPCTNHCVFNKATGVCQGCLRTLKEIGEWRTYSDEEKLAHKEDLKKRKLDSDISCGQTN